MNCAARENAQDNQPSIEQAIRLVFENRGAPDYSEPFTVVHGRLESRSIWTSTALNDYLDFPFVDQVFAIERHVIIKKTGKESHHYMLDWNWNEDRCTIRTGHGPENISRLRRFATGLIKSISKDDVA